MVILHPAEAKLKCCSIVSGASHQMSCVVGWEKTSWKDWFNPSLSVNILLVVFLKRTTSVNIYMPRLAALRDGEHLETGCFWLCDLLTHGNPYWALQAELGVTPVVFWMLKTGENLICSGALLFFFPFFCGTLCCTSFTLVVLFFFIRCKPFIEENPDKHSPRTHLLTQAFTWTQCWFQCESSL